jgi:hypothetical protein
MHEVARHPALTDNAGAGVAGRDARDGGKPASEGVDAGAEPVRPKLRWWIEAIVVYACYHAYEWARAGVKGSAAGANAHADQVYRLEKASGLLIERHVQDWVLPHVRLAQFFDIYYGTVHFVLPVVTFVVLWRMAPERYVRMRRTIFALTLMGLFCFAAWPLAPPRLWPSEAHPFLVDTANTVGGLGPLDSGGMKDLSNLYAAMPSLHVGWSSWCALSLTPMLWARRHRVWAVLALVDPVLTTLAVMATGNHWILDGIVGVAFLAVAYGGAVGWERWRARRLHPDVVIT